MPRLAPAALFLALFAAACARAPQPPYPLAFDAAIRSPRLLTTSEEITVPVSLRNRGERSWDPQSIHLSYHWLWVVPRELVRRSRTVPYQDGIRTELGARTVAPGREIALEARLLAPSWPGVYWLQWDMVEEHVTWFSQVAPRQRRALVLIVPPLAWLLAPLPLVVVVVACFSRNRSFVAIADIVWCAATLAAKPLIVEHEALLEPTALSYALQIAIAVAVPALAAILLPRRARPFVLLAIGIVASTALLADVVYYRFFGDVWSTPALLAARQTGHVWGSVSSLFTPGLAWLIADWPFAAAMAVRVSRTAAETPSRLRSGAAASIAIVAAPLAVIAPRALSAAPLDQMFRARAIVEQLGPFGYHAYDTFSYARSTWLHGAATPEQVAAAADWFNSRAPLRQGGTTFGAARGRNLIVVQVESLQDFAVDFRVEGQEVMPHLRRWTDTAIRFTDVTDQTSEGRTSDAEFTTLTSLLPLDHGAVAFRFPANHYVALPRVLADHGYATLSAVAFEPGFWNRQVMHPAYGFARTLFEPDFQMTEQIGWGLNDRDFLQQMVPRLEQLPRPFAAWMITLSLHHPFADFPAAHKVLKLGAIEGTPFGNYLHTMRFFDQALEDFRVALARDGLLDSSVVMVFGDHDAGFARTAALARTIGIGNDDVAWALNDRVPLFIRIPERDGATEQSGAGAVRTSGITQALAGAGDSSAPRRDVQLTGARDMPAGQTDVAPTLLSLLGIDAAPLPFVGRNLLRDEAVATDAAIASHEHDRAGRGGDGSDVAERHASDAAGGPVPRPYGDWLDAHHLFLAHGTLVICYDLAARATVTADACRDSDARSRRERDVSRLVVVHDLQQRLRR